MIRPMKRDLPGAAKKVEKGDDMFKKFDRVMDHGTPRIVTKNFNRQIQIDNPK